MAPTFSMAYFSKSPKNLGDMMSILNVLMSIQLPFAVIPMLTFTSSRYVNMVIGVVEFSSGGYKIRKIVASESTYSKKIIEFWN